MPAAVPSWAAVLMVPDAVPRYVPGTVVSRWSRRPRIGRVRLLGAEPGQHLSRPITRTDQATRLCADIADATIDLLTGPDTAAVALCDAPGCGQLYLRAGPNQQWCSPHCGTRARSQRYADRKPRARRS